MPATLTSVRARYEYNPRTMRYRDTRSGRWVQRRVVKAAVTRVISAATLSMRTLARDMAAQRITLGQWQERMAAEIKSLHVATAMAGAGGMGQMKPRDYGRVGARLKFEYDRLERFAGQLADGQVTERQLLNRVEMYVASGHTTHEAARFDQAVDAGYSYESNVLGRREHHCKTTPEKPRPGCLDQTARGRVPLGTLVPVGERQCLSRCGCGIAYHRKLRKSESKSATA